MRVRWAGAKDTVLGPTGLAAGRWKVGRRSESEDEAAEDWDLDGPLIGPDNTKRVNDNTTFVSRVAGRGAEWRIVVSLPVTTLKYLFNVSVMYVSFYLDQVCVLNINIKNIVTQITD